MPKEKSKGKVKLRKHLGGFDTPPAGTLTLPGPGMEAAIAEWVNDHRGSMNMGPWRSEGVSSFRHGRLPGPRREGDTSYTTDLRGPTRWNQYGGLLQNVDRLSDEVEQRRVNSDTTHGPREAPEVHREQRVTDARKHMTVEERAAFDEALARLRLRAGQ